MYVGCGPDLVAIDADIGLLKSRVGVINLVKVGVAVFRDEENVRNPHRRPIV